MQQKLITFAVPCYNSAAYMRHCIETLLSAGEQAEIILVDDGSVKDDTPAICDEYAAKYPTIVKAIHQENGGHGEGVNQGIRNATGLYYKVVDSDDWLDTDALKKVLERLTTLVARGTAPDLMICNYVYEHVEDGTSHTVRYTNVFPLSSGGQTQGALGLYSLVMTKKTKNAALAADFIKYLTTSDEIQLAHNTVQNLMPTTKTAIANEYYQTAEWSVFINQLNNIVARPGSAAWPAIQRSLAEYVTQLVTGDKNGVPDQLDAIEIQLNEALEDLEDE